MIKKWQKTFKLFVDIVYKLGINTSYVFLKNVEHQTDIIDRTIRTNENHLSFLFHRYFWKTRRTIHNLDPRK